jgi:hypothetical protein
MAENSNILITVTTDSEGAVQSINKLGAEVNQAGEKAQTLKQQIRELQNVLTSGKVPEGTAEYKKLSAQLSDLKDKQRDFNEEIGANAGSAIEATGNNLNLFKDRLLSLDFEGAAVSAKSLAGNISSLDFGKVSQGIGSLGKAFGAVGKALLTNPIFLIAGAIGAAIVYSEELLSLIDGVSDAEQESLNIQKEKAATAQKELDSVGAQENILKRQGLTEKEILQIKIQKGKAAINEQKATILTLELQKKQQIEAAERNRDILKGLINFISIPLTAVLAGVDLITSGLNKAGLIADDTFSKIGNLRDKYTGSLAELVFDPEEVAKEGDKSIEEAKDRLEKLENQQAGFENSIDSINAQAADKARQRAEQRKAVEKETQEAINASKEEQFQATLSAEEKELRQVALKYDKLKEKAGENKELQKQLIEQERLESQAIRDKYFEEELTKLAEQEAKRIEAERIAAAKANEERIAREDAQFALEQELRLKNLSANEAARQKATQDLVADYDAKLLLAKDNATLTAELEKQRTAELEKINQDYRDAEKAADEKAQKDKIDAFMATSEMISQSSQNGLSTLLSLNELFAGKSEASQKKAFQRNKALQIAQAGVATYQSATSAFASQIIPGDPTSPARGFIAAAAAIAAGLVNIAKIKATTFSSPAPSGGSSGGGGGGLSSTGVASSGAPEFNPLSALNFNQPQQIQPAYVLASDIASSMEARSKVEDLSRL